MLATLLHMMKGTPYVFQGDELGMKDVPFTSLDQYKDIETVFMCQKMRMKVKMKKQSRNMLI